MKPRGARAAKLVLLFMAGMLLFNYPLMALFNVQASLLGIPILYFYIFAAWALLIVLVAAVMERGG